MKLVQVSTFYQSYLKKFYEKRPGLELKTFQDQKTSLDHDAFGWADFWVHSLMPHGYESVVFIADAEHLQRAWARENGVGFDANWQHAIIREQIRREKPEILFIEDHHFFTPQQVRELRSENPSIRLVIGSCGSPYKSIEIFREYDFTFSCIPELVDQFRSGGAKAYLIAHGFDPRVLERIDLSKRAGDDFTFVGQIVRTNAFHLEREKILEALVDKVPVQIYSPSAELNAIQMLKSLVKRRQLPLSMKLRPYMKPSVFGLEMFQTLRNSKVTFNKHIDLSPRSASNMRLFESTGVGTCLLTDFKPNIRNFFDPDYEIVTYSSPEEAVSKARWLLQNPKKYFEIADAGQKRTLRDHNFTNRAQELNDYLRKHL